jgi:chloramphenicol 3-O-phosphotransferase
MLFRKRKAGSPAAAIVLLAGSLCTYGQADGAEGPQRLFAPWSNVALDIELEGLMSKLWDDTAENR